VGRGGEEEGGGEQFERGSNRDSCSPSRYAHAHSYTRIFPPTHSLSLSLTHTHTHSPSSLPLPLQSKAQVALAAYGDLSARLLHASNGYLVELTGSGLCLATFADAADAVMWSLSLQEAMKRLPWDPEMLQHEVCV
jgi:hypothetical protein